MPASDGETQARQPDWALLTKDRMPDRGPRYTETPADPYAPNSPFIAEPWNAVTASFFIGIVVAWAWRLRGRYRNTRSSCVACRSCWPAASGGRSTTPRASRLSIFCSMSFRSHCSAWPGRSSWRSATSADAELWVLPARGAGLHRCESACCSPPLGRSDSQLRINLSYASARGADPQSHRAGTRESRFRHGGWVVAGLISFVIAWIFRLVDRDIGPYLAMGSHWLWHTFGAITTALIIEYFYLVEGEKPQRSVTKPSEAEPTLVSVVATTTSLHHLTRRLPLARACEVFHRRGGPLRASGEGAVAGVRPRGGAGRRSHSGLEQVEPRAHHHRLGTRKRPSCRRCRGGGTGLDEAVPRRCRPHPPRHRGAIPAVQRLLHDRRGRLDRPAGDAERRRRFS